LCGRSFSDMLFLILIVDIVVAKPLNETVDADSSNNETFLKVRILRVVGTIGGTET